METIEKRSALIKERRDMAPEHAYGFFDTPLGLVRIAEDGRGITSLQFTDGGACSTQTGGRYLPDAKAQLLEYFAGKRRTFDLPLSTHGSEFQERVWAALGRIPYGETRSYRQIAGMIGNDQAARAVGMANNRNPILILIPCHRVIGRDGSLAGYAGGIERKRRLLELEGREA